MTIAYGGAHATEPANECVLQELALGTTAPYTVQMPQILIRIGYAILIAAILLVSPLADEMPVDLASRLAGLTHPGAHAVHFRIVPAQGDGLERVSMALFLIGLAVLGAGLVLKARMKRSRRS